MKTTSISLLVLATCCAGCLPPTLLAARDRPHRVAERATVIGWCAAPEAPKVEKCKVELVPGDVILGQELFAPPEPKP